MRLSLFALLAFSAALGGCANLIDGKPKPVSDPELEIEALRPQYDGKAVSGCIDTPTTTCRNRVIGARMHAANLRFVDFEQALFREGRSGSFGSSVAAIARSAGATASTGGTAQALSAANTLLLGSREALNKDLLAERTTVALHSAMRARRAEVATRLRRGLQQPIDLYPFAVALDDLNDYVHAGSLLGAVIGLNETASVAAKQADAALADVMRVDFARRSDLSAAIGGALCTTACTAEQLPAALARLKPCLPAAVAARPNGPLHLVTGGPDVTDAEREAVLACLKRKP